MGGAHGFRRAAGRVRVARLASGVQRGPVAGQCLAGAAGPHVQVGEVHQRGRPLAGQSAALGDLEDEQVDAVQIGRRCPGPEVRHHGPHELGHQPAGQGVQFPVLDGEPGGGEQRRSAGAQPVGGGARIGEAQRGRGVQQFLPRARAVGLGDGAAGLEQPQCAFQHPGAGQPQLPGAVLGLGAGAQQGLEAAGDLVLGQRGGQAVQEPGIDALVEERAGGLHGAAGQRGGGLRVGRDGGHEGEQPQHPPSGGGQSGVGEPEDPGERGAGRGAALGVGVEVPGDVGDGGLGAGGEPAPGEDQRGGLAAAGLGELLGGAGVDGDADGAGAAGEQFHRGRGVQAAERAGPDVGDAGQRSPGDGDDEAVGAVRQQRVDLFGARRVVQQEQQAPLAECLAQQVAQLVLTGAGRYGPAERGEQVTGGAFGGDGGAVRFAEPGAEHPVGVAVGDPAQQFLGERGAALAGASGDEQHPGARGLAAGEGVESGPGDVGAQFAQLVGAAEEFTAGVLAARGLAGGGSAAGGRKAVEPAVVLGPAAGPAVGPGVGPAAGGPGAGGRGVRRGAGQSAAVGVHRLFHHGSRSRPTARADPPHSARVVLRA
nr:hypothetical protein [Streptomyces sp. MH191]